MQKLFRMNHRTAQPSLQVGTRQLTTSTSRGWFFPLSQRITERNVLNSQKINNTTSRTEKTPPKYQTVSGTLVRHTELQICTRHFEEISFPNLHSSQPLVDPYVGEHRPLLDVTGTHPAVCCRTDVPPQTATHKGRGRLKTEAPKPPIMQQRESRLHSQNRSVRKTLL